MANFGKFEKNSTFGSVVQTRRNDPHRCNSGREIRMLRQLAGDFSVDRAKLNCDLKNDFLIQNGEASPLDRAKLHRYEQERERLLAK